MVTLLEVMITSQVTITSQEVIVTSPINEQMVEAFVKFLLRIFTEEKRNLIGLVLPQ